MFTFRGMTEDAERLAERIHRLLQGRHAMHIGEMRIRLGVEEEVLQAQIGEMMACGEIERLRPIDYPSDDHDFFRLNSWAPAVTATRCEYGPRDVMRLEERAQLAGEAMVCFAG